MSALVQIVQGFLRHPSLLAEIALLIAVLFGAGRALGLPLLFWHERRGAQFLAGVSATLLVGEIVFVTYLADEPYRVVPLELRQFLVIGGAGWGVVVLTASLYRLFRRRLGSSAVTPRFRAIADGNLGELVAANPPTWPFVLGCASGAAAVAALTILSEAPIPALTSLSTSIFGPRLLHATMHLAAALTFALMLLAFFVAPIATPAIELCALLGMVTAAYGALAFFFRSSGGTALLIASGVLLIVGGLRPRRLQITALKDWYAKPATYPPASAEARGSRLLRFNEGWPSGDPRPLILVCTSGGGIRAATWTAAILNALAETSPRFCKTVRLITGASGGMVGAAAWVARLHSGGTPANLVEAVAGDALSAVASRLLFRDIPFAFLPLANDANRGRALELTWSANTEGALNVPLGTLREKERTGELPSLVFSPMIVEDGRRLILSNLDLSLITTNHVRWLGHSQPEAASISAFHIEELLPGALDQIPLFTAARLAASFPYVSPASALPTEPSRRVVDAGYYDNYGLSLACEWLREALINEKAWIEQNVSRILLLQIRDNVSELSVDGEEHTEPHPQERYRFGQLSATAARGFEWLTSPIRAVLSARESVMLFRNDAAVEAATALYDSQLAPGFLTTTIFEFKGEASLSWYLTKTEYAGICAQAGSKGIEVKIRHVADWL